MTARDLAWRAGGTALTAVGFVASRATPGDPGWAAALSLLAFLMAIGGLVLVVQGDRVPRALRIERSRHRHLPDTLVHRRQTRAGGGSSAKSPGN